jgi:glycosyltransferase involved in cell wall biosynthesis
MKKILILVDSIDINMSSGARANFAIIQNLAKRVFGVTVIHNSNIDFDKGLENISYQRLRISKFNLLYFLGGLNRVLYRNTNIDLNKFIEPIFGFSPEYFSTAGSFRKKVLEFGKVVDLIITLSQGASFRPHYAMLNCPLFYKKWLAYIHDPYPFHFYPRPYNWVQRGFRQKEIFFAKMAQRAQYFGFPSQLLLEWMGSYFPEMEKKGILIPHQISETPPESFLTSTYWNDDAFNILHAGNLLKQRPVEGLLEGFKLFLEKTPKANLYARLHLIGPAEYHESKLKKYEAELPELRLNLKGVPFNHAYWLQRNASVNIILESKSEISPFLPGKFPHCVEAGTPILLLGPYYSETKRLLGKEYPYWCENHDVKVICDHLEKLFNSWKENKGNLISNQDKLITYMSSKNLHLSIENLL